MDHITNRSPMSLNFQRSSPGPYLYPGSVRMANITTGQLVGVLVGTVAHE
jgi:hypothetical protein